MMLSSLLSTTLLFGPILTGPAHFVAPAAECHAEIAARCSALLGEEALRCRNEADAQCDISDAEHFIAEGDVDDTMSRLDQARGKYEDLLNVMIADVDPAPIAETMVRYAVASASIFALLARDGEIDSLARAVRRLERSRAFLENLLERRVDLVGHPDVGAALEDLTKRLAAALDQLARREVRRAEQRYKAVRNGESGDGGAQSYYVEAARHSAEAYALIPNLAYKVVGFDAELAQAELNTMLARNSPSAAAPACAGYRRLRQELGELERSDAKGWKEHPRLRNFQGRAERGARSCAARPRLVAGGVMMGIGAAGLGAALGLYARYDAACEYSTDSQSCAGITAGSPDADRFTTQVRASIGLAVVGGALLTAGAAVLVHGLVQRKQAQPRRFSLAPTFGPHQTGGAFSLRF